MGNPFSISFLSSYCFYSDQELLRQGRLKEALDNRLVAVERLVKEGENPEHNHCFCANYYMIMKILLCANLKNLARKYAYRLLRCGGYNFEITWSYARLLECLDCPDGAEALRSFVGCDNPEASDGLGSELFNETRRAWDEAYPSDDLSESTVSKDKTKEDTITAITPEQKRQAIDPATYIDL